MNAFLLSSSIGLVSPGNRRFQTSRGGTNGEARKRMQLIMLACAVGLLVWLADQRQHSGKDSAELTNDSRLNILDSLASGLPEKDSKVRPFLRQ